MAPFIKQFSFLQVNWEKYKKALKLCCLNVFLVGPLFNVVMYPLNQWRGNECNCELPSFATTVWHLFGFIVVEEIGFYYIHRFELSVTIWSGLNVPFWYYRLLHYPKFYKHVHKIHHEWTAPTGISAVYTHPLEHVLSNLLPVWLGPFIMGSHLSVTWLWYIAAILNTTVTHSGYHFPFLPSPEAHDYHHHK